ncbi:MAG: A24 family peptidase [Candidatus Micrarchaeota archaeon]
MINILVAVLGTALAAVEDFRTGWVSDWITHGMIVFGIVWTLLFAQQQMFFVFAVAAAVFLLGYAAYAFGQMGGGDVKLFTALALLVPYHPAELSPYLQQLGITPVPANYPFIVSIFVMFGLLYMFFISIIYLRKIYERKQKIKDFRQKITKGVIYAALFVPIIVLWTSFFRSFIVFAPAIFLSMLLLPFKDDIIKLFFMQNRKVSQLNNEDVFALEFIPVAVKKKLGLWRKTFTDVELGRIKAKAKKAKINSLPVCDHMPCAVPYIFGALLISLILGDFILWLVLNVG